MSPTLETTGGKRRRKTVRTPTWISLRTRASAPEWMASWAPGHQPKGDMELVWKTLLPQFLVRLSTIALFEGLPDFIDVLAPLLPFSGKNEALAASNTAPRD